MSERPEHERSQHVDELLDPYRTGELDAAAERRVAEHLESCAACRGALGDLEAFSEVMGRAYAAETATRAAEREPDWGRLRAAIVERTSARPTVPRRSWFARHVPQTAVAVLALLAVGVLWRQGIRRPTEAERGLRKDRPAATSERDAVPSAARTGDEDSRFGSAGETKPQMEAGGEREAAARIANAPVKREAPGVEADELYRAPEGAEPMAPAEDLADVRTGRRIEDLVKEPPPSAEAEAADEAAEAGWEKARRAAPRERAAQAGAVGLQRDSVAGGDEVERFRRLAREALAEEDLALAETALAQWRDSLASGDDLPSRLRQAAQALADSLAAFLATRP